MKGSSDKSDHSCEVDSNKQLDVYQEVQSEPQVYHTAKNMEAQNQLFEKDIDGYSTPSHNERSKISCRRLVKAFEKSESRLKRQMEKEQGMSRQLPESRGTAPRFGMERQPYNYGMGMQQPQNVYYVHSSFDRPPQGPCRLACCTTPNQVHGYPQ